VNNNFRNKIDACTGRDQKLLNNLILFKRILKCGGKTEVWVERLDACM